MPSFPIADRIEGFLARCTEHGVPREAIRQAQGEGATHLDIGYAAMQRLVSQSGWPAGLLCPSDLIAYAAYRLASETGKMIPRDCRIIGIDDNVFNAWIAPWLSSVSIPYREFGPVVVDQLRACWSGTPATSRILPHRLIRR